MWHDNYMNVLNSFGSSYLNSSSGSETDWVTISSYSTQRSSPATNSHVSSCSSSHSPTMHTVKIAGPTAVSEFLALKSTEQTQSLAVNTHADFHTGCRLVEFSRDSTDSSLCNAEEDTAQTETSATWERYLNSHREKEFSKYIPVNSNKTTLYVPKCSFHKVYQQEWEDAQQAYELQHAYQNLQKARVSKSDNFVFKPRPRNRRNSKVARLVAHIFKHKSRLKGDQDVMSNKPQTNNQRFSEVTNKRYICVNIKPDPDFVVTLFVQSPAQTNVGLCHVKTELVVAAMLNFFHPYSNVQCLWVKDLQERILKMTVGQIVQSKFHKTIHLREYEAALVVSEEAGVLLRHRDTVFIQSLALALDINSNNLIVLVDKNKTVIC